MQLSGNEPFTMNGVKTEFSVIDFWKFKFSNIYFQQEKIAEYLVAKALGKEESDNDEYWTLFDIEYRGNRIEVKTTSYFHPWNKTMDISKVRRWGIDKANSNYEYENGENRYERQNDVYVFCLNTGNTEEESYPLELDNWQFFIVPTAYVNEHFDSQKSISLGRLKDCGFEAVSWDRIKMLVDQIIDEEQKMNEVML